MLFPGSTPITCGTSFIAISCNLPACHYSMPAGEAAAVHPIRSNEYAAVEEELRDLLPHPAICWIIMEAFMPMLLNLKTRNVDRRFDNLNPREV